MSDYEIEAELLVNTRAATSGLSALSSRLSSFGSTLRGTSSVFGSMVGQAVAFGGAYLGVSAMVSGFRNLATEAFRFQQEVGGAQLGLQSIMSQVEGITDQAGNWHPVGFEAAASLSGEAYRHMQDMAITSSATSAELLGIFQSTYGAARSAGASMQDVYDLTANASTAAAALGIDFQQASRDMGAMLRGGAGLDVKLFSSLRSMNAIAMDAQEFNRLSPEDRVATLSRALQGFEAANAAYGRSLPGALSTTTDLFELFRGAFFGPAFAKMAELLNELNGYLIANKDAIKAYLTDAGTRFRDFLVDGVDRARAAFDYVRVHWDEIVGKVHEAVSTLQRMAPIIASWAGTFVKMRIAAMALGVALQAGGWLAGATSGLVEAAGAVGIGAAAEGAAVGAAGAGAAAAGGGGLAAVGAALSALALPLAAVAAAVVAVWQGFETFGEWLMPMVADVTAIFSGVGEDLFAIVSDVWDFLQPIFAAVGAILAGAFLTALKFVGAALRVVLGIVRMFGEVLSWVGTHIIRPVFEAIGNVAGVILTKFGELATGLSGVMDKIREFLRMVFRPPASETPSPGGALARLGYAPGVRVDWSRVSQTPETTAAPNARTTVHNDFRGSRITVQQEFREADPDRVAVRMLEDITRFAEQRVQSGFAPAFTR